MSLNKKYQDIVISFLYRLSKTRAFSISELVEWFQDFFGFENVVVFYYNNSLLEESQIKPYASKPYTGVSAHLNGLQADSIAADDIINQYVRHYCKEDFMEASQLPIHLRGRDIIMSSDFSSEVLEKSEYYQFLKSNHLSNILCLYIRNKDNACIARIGILRPDGSDEFTSQEIESLQILGRFISLKIDSAIYHQLKIKQGRLLEDAVTRMDSGLIILSRHMSIRYCNPAAERLCEEMSDSFRNDSTPESLMIHSGSAIDNVIRYIFIKYHQSNQSCTTYKTNEHEYRCELITSTYVEKDRPNIFYYFIYISKQEYHQSRDSFDNFVKQYNLTKREADVLDLIQAGYDNNQICETLFISMNTVKTHISKIYRKAGISSRSELLFILKK